MFISAERNKRGIIMKNADKEHDRYYHLNGDYIYLQ